MSPVISGVATMKEKKVIIFLTKHLIINCYYQLSYLLLYCNLFKMLKLASNSCPIPVFLPWRVLMLDCGYQHQRVLISHTHTEISHTHLFPFALGSNNTILWRPQYCPCQLWPCLTAQGLCFIKKWKFCFYCCFLSVCAWDLLQKEL